MDEPNTNISSSQVSGFTYAGAAPSSEEDDSESKKGNKKGGKRKGTQRASGTTQNKKRAPASVQSNHRGTTTRAASGTVNRRKETTTTTTTQRGTTNAVSGTTNAASSTSATAPATAPAPTERLAEAEEALALAKKEVRVAAAAVSAATAEEVGATITALTTATAAATAARAARDAAKVAATEAARATRVAAKVAATEIAAARAVREVAAARAVREAAKKEKKEGEEAEKIISAIASEHRKIQAVLGGRGEEKKRPLSANTLQVYKRQKKQRDRIRDITPPSWLEEDPVMHELHQQIQAEASEREQRVAKTKNETNRYEKMVAMKMKKWLVSGAVREVAPIKKKRKDLEEQARIQRIDDQADSLLLDYGYKMDKFVLETMQTMQPYLEAAAIINNSDPPGTVATSPPLSILQLTLCGIYHGVCKELKVIQEANVAPQLGKCLHDIIPRDSRTIADKNKGVFFRKIIKVCNCYLDFLIMICEALTSDLGTRGNNKIMKVLAYQVNREKEDMMMKVLNLICTEAHAVQSLFCHENGALQKKLLKEIVPRFIDCKSLFLIDGDLLSTLTKVEFDFEVIAHELIWKRHLYNIQAFKENCCPLPADTAKLNLNIANATMQHVHYREKDGSYTKSPKKVLVFGIRWCIIVFCTGASGVSFCRNGDLVLHKFDREILVDCRGRVFERGQFDVNVELREVPQQVDGDGYYFVHVYFCSQFIPYIYESTMRVPTLQWAGILGSWYLLDETMDHLTGEKDKNGILHTQPANKQENRDRMDLQGLAPLVDGRKCIY